MEWSPQINRKIPIYRQIVHHFEDQIIKGKLLPGSLLPTERVLAVRLGVNRSTVATAYAELRAEGLISSVQGSGTKVNEDVGELIETGFFNWNRYKNETYSPVKPIVTRIMEVKDDKGFINLASSEFNEHKKSSKRFQQLLENNRSSNGDVRLTLLEELQRQLNEKWNFSLDKDMLVLTQGIQQSILLLNYTLLNPGDTVALETPSFMYSSKLFSTAGIKVVPLMIREDGIDPTEVQTLYRKYRIKMVYTNPTLQNPTGKTMPQNKRQELLNVCGNLDIPIVEVDCSRPLHDKHPNSLPPTLFGMSTEKGNVIHLASTLDTLDPSVKIGWIAAAKSVIDRLKDAKLQMGMGPSPLSLQLFNSIMKSGYWDFYINEQRQLNQHKNSLLIRMLNEYCGPDIQVEPFTGSSRVWCKLNIPISDEELLEACIRHKVLVVPGSVYGSDAGFVRFSTDQQTEHDIKEGVIRFSHAFQETLPKDRLSL